MTKQKYEVEQLLDYCRHEGILMAGVRSAWFSDRDLKWLKKEA